MRSNESRSRDIQEAKESGEPKPIAHSTPMSSVETVDREKEAEEDERKKEIVDWWKELAQRKREEEEEEEEDEDDEETLKLTPVEKVLAEKKKSAAAAEAKSLQRDSKVKFGVVNVQTFNKRRPSGVLKKLDLESVVQKWKSAAKKRSSEVLRQEEAATTKTKSLDDAAVSPPKAREDEGKASKVESFAYGTARKLLNERIIEPYDILLKYVEEKSLGPDSVARIIALLKTTKGEPTSTQAAPTSPPDTLAYPTPFQKALEDAKPSDERPMPQAESLDYISPSKLDQKYKERTPPQAESFDYISPSKLDQKYKERNPPQAETIDYKSPSKLDQKYKERTPPQAESFDYISPSKLDQKYKERNPPQAETIDYKSPSKLDQKYKERNPPQAESFDYISPSKLDQKYKERTPPQAESFDYISPSKLDQKYKERTPPQAESFDYVSPSKLNQKYMDNYPPEAKGKADDKLSGETESEAQPTVMYRSSWYSPECKSEQKSSTFSASDIPAEIWRDFLQHLVEQQQDGVSHESVLKVQDYVTAENPPDNRTAVGQDTEGRSTAAATLRARDSVGKQVAPSDLLIRNIKQKYAMAEDAGGRTVLPSAAQRQEVKGHAPSDSALEGPSPSELLKRYKAHNPPSAASLPDYTTPSKLLQKYNDQARPNQTATSPSLPDHTTTPSQLMDLCQDAEVKGLGAFGSVLSLTPSRAQWQYNMMFREESEEEEEEEVGNVSGLYTLCSQSYRSSKQKGSNNTCFGPADPRGHMVRYKKSIERRSKYRNRAL